MNFLRTPIGKSAALIGLTALFAVSMATAQVGSTGNTGIDATGNTQSERAACMAGRTQQDRATCLREANNAAADKRNGKLDNAGSASFTANALARCDALSGQDMVACQARVLGYGATQGSVAGGGVIREVEIIQVPANPVNGVIIEPQTSSPVLLMVPGQTVPKQ